FSSLFSFLFYLSALLLTSLFFFLHHPATTAIYTLSLHDALPISQRRIVAQGLTHLGDARRHDVQRQLAPIDDNLLDRVGEARVRSEEHTSELQSPDHLVCRLLLEKKKKQHYKDTDTPQTTSREDK